MFLKVLTVAVLGVGAAAASWMLSRRAAGMQAGTGPTIQQVQELAELVTSRIEIADVQETSAEGMVGGMKVALLVKGDCLLSVDLAKARFEAVDSQKRTAVLVLPRPMATQPRLDHQRTKIFAITSSGLWLIAPGNGGQSLLIDRAFRDAQQCVARAAGDPKLADGARDHAERVIRRFFEPTGWTIRVRWVSGAGVE